MPPRYRPVGKLGIVDWREDCSSCHNCVKRGCVYGFYRDEADTLRDEIGYLDYIYQCKGCLSCIQNCTKNILTRVVNPEYERLGDDYYTPGHRARHLVPGGNAGGFLSPARATAGRSAGRASTPCGPTCRKSCVPRATASTAANTSAPASTSAASCRIWPSRRTVGGPAAAAGGNAAAGRFSTRGRRTGSAGRWSRRSLAGGGRAGHAGCGTRGRRRPPRWPAVRGRVVPLVSDIEDAAAEPLAKAPAGDARRRPRRFGPASAIEAAERRARRGNSSAGHAAPVPSACWNWPVAGPRCSTWSSIRTGASNRVPLLACPAVQVNLPSPLAGEGTRRHARDVLREIHAH